MRWYIFHCLLLAAVALDGSSGRSKRDLMYLKNLFKNLLEATHRDTKPAMVDSAHRIPALRYDNIVRVSETNHNIFGSDGPMHDLKDHLVSSVLTGTTKRVIHETIPPVRLAITLDADEKDTMREVPRAPDLAKPKLGSNLPTHTQYFYAQLKNNKPVLTFVTKNISESVSANTKIRSALPKCIQKRISELIVLGNQPDLISDIQSSYPITLKNKIEFPLGHKHTNRKSEGLFFTKSPKKVSKVHIQEQPYFTSHDSWPTDIVGLIHPSYISRKTTSGGDVKDLTDIPEYSAANVVKKTEPFISRYSYKQLNHNSPAPLTEVKVGSEVLTNLPPHISNLNGPFNQISNKFVYVPPFFGDYISEAFPDKIGQNIGLKDDVDFTMKHSNEAVDDNLERQPIVVADDNNYKYYASSVSGSSIRFKSNGNVNNKNRGDIPE